MVTTLQELVNVLQDHLDAGLDQDTPVRLRTKRAPCESDTDPVVCYAEDVWATPQGELFIDQAGI